MEDRRRSKAVIFTEFGSPDVLRYVDVEEPHPGPGEVRIGVRAAGVNPLDVKIRRGMMEAMFPTALPHVLGMELAGVVDEIGEGVDDWKVGDEVVASFESPRRCHGRLRVPSGSLPRLQRAHLTYSLSPLAERSSFMLRPAALGRSPRKSPKREISTSSGRPVSPITTT